MKSSSGKGGSGPSILDYFSKSKRTKAPKSRSTPPSFGTSGTPHADGAGAMNATKTPASVVSDDSAKEQHSAQSDAAGGNKPACRKRPHLGAPASSAHTPDTHGPNTPPSPTTEGSPPAERGDGAIGGKRSAHSSETPPTNDAHNMTTPRTPPTPDTWRGCPVVQVQKENVSNYAGADTPGDGKGSPTAKGGAGTPQCLLEPDDARFRGLSHRQPQREQLNMGTPSTIGTPSTAPPANPPSNNFFGKYPATTKSSLGKSKKARGTDQTAQAKPAKKQKQTNQLFLDFGQNSFGKRTICGICGMMRVHGLDEDDAEHAKVCKEYKEGVACAGWKNERCVGTFGKDRILEVRPDDAPQHQKKVRDVKAIVDKELGFASRSSVDPSGADAAMTSYLYISKKRVVGLLTVKRIQRAYAYLPSKEGDSISRSLKPARALLGVHQIWVHKAHRQKGIASNLVTAARDHLIFGMAVPLELVAFSSPTDEGLRFAQGYIGSEKPLIYDIH
ncbi:hypothetical protein ACHAXT_000495 [Thalassiosira profunda]